MLTSQIIVNITWILVVLSLAAGIFGTVLFTELGQLLKLPSKWLYAVYPYLGKASIVLIVIAGFVLIQQFRLGFMNQWLAIGYMVILLGSIFLTNYFVPDIWLRGHHHTAKFIPVSEADAMLDDTRLPAQEQIWGISLGGEQVGFAQSFVKQHPLYNTVIGNTPVLVAWFPEYETLGVFNRNINGNTVEVNEIDVYGNTSSGKLQKLPQYPHVFWRVWSHWYPQTKVNI